MTEDLLSKAIALHQKSEQLATIIQDLDTLPIIINIGSNENIRLVNDGTNEVELNMYNGVSDLIKAYKQSIDAQFEAL